MTPTTDSSADLLLVDDQPPNLELLTRLLRQSGYRVRSVTSGTRALEAACLAPPDCILLDVQMPGIDGFETCRLLRQKPELVEVPVIFLTAADDAESRLRGFSVGARDYISKPFHAEEVLARVATHVRLARLERELREQNARLLAANGQLEQASVLKASLSAMLVHDVRSPLTVVYAAMEDPTDEEARGDALVALRKVDKLLGELLELHRGGSAERPPQLVDTDVDLLVDGVVSSVRAIARARGIALERTHATGAGLRARIDAARIDRVLSNLLDNAMKFTEAGGRIIVNTELESGRGVEEGLRFAVISVRDSGPGIPAPDLAYVFEPFHQRAEGRAKGGYGLGLAIVQRLVAEHGGRVRVHSREGVGTEFRVLLPL